jgi:uncharacterized membrane protein
MVVRLFAALSLMALCVTIHAGGVSGAIRTLRQRGERAHTFWPDTWLFIVVAAWMVLLHLLEVSVWAAFYLWQGEMADLLSSLYFSAVTYTTTGYGDIVLKDDWRILSGVEALTGILMCGWSTGFFMAIVSRMYEGRSTMSGR